MKRPDPDPLATWADRALEQLPAPRTPAGLSPRILDAVRRRAARPWYRRPWNEWPLPGRLSSLALLSGLVAGLAWLTHSAPTTPLAEGLRGEAGARLGWMAPVADSFSALGHAGLLLLQNVQTSHLVALIAVGIAAWTTCLGLGTAVWRIAHPAPR